MHQISTKTAPSVFLSKFKKPSHCIQSEFLTLVTLSQLESFINISAGFQLANPIPGMDF